MKLLPGHVSRPCSRLTNFATAKLIARFVAKNATAALYLRQEAVFYDKRTERYGHFGGAAMSKRMWFALRYWLAKEQAIANLVRARIAMGRPITYSHARHKINAIVKE
jgi:hypothetical protein